MGGWKVSLPCTRAEADALRDLPDPFPGRPDPPTVLAREPDESRPDAWLIEAYTTDEPDVGLLAAVAALAPSAVGVVPTVEPLPDDDWVTLSQAGIEPVGAGRFHVHDANHADSLRPGQIALRIDAGLAFGTGQHATTTGCLIALDRLARTRRFADVLDVGTGTGILALAAAKRWRRARVTASDIDPVAVAVARANTRLNRERPGAGAGRLLLAVAPGLEHRRLRTRAPYDLVCANILAGPLVMLAPAIVGNTKPGGIIMLAGLLASQERRVLAAYAARGCRPLFRVATGGGEWPTLVLTRATLRGARRGTAGRRPTQTAW